MTTAGCPAIDRSTRIRRNPDLLTAEVDGEVVMMSVEQGVYYGLDDIGSDVWNRLAEPVTVASLLTGLQARYDGDAAIIERDVMVLLADMAAKDLIRIEGL